MYYPVSPTTNNPQQQHGDELLRGMKALIVVSAAADTDNNTISATTLCRGVANDLSNAGAFVYLAGGSSIASIKELRHIQKGLPYPEMSDILLVGNDDDETTNNQHHPMLLLADHHHHGNPDRIKFDIVVLANHDNWSILQKLLLRYNNNNDNNIAILKEGSIDIDTLHEAIMRSNFCHKAHRFLHQILSPKCMGNYFLVSTATSTTTRTSNHDYEYRGGGGGGGWPPWSVQEGGEEDHHQETATNIIGVWELLQ